MTSPRDGSPYYFSRPLSWAALWAGKFLGGAALVLGAFLCSSLPMLLASDGIGREAFAFWVVNLLFLTGFAHAITSMFRSRSRLVALDLCLGIALLALFVAVFRHLLAAGAGHFVWGTLLPAAIAAAALAALAAAAAQLAHGRADARRGHAALSTTLWTLASATLGALALWGAWVLRVTPAESGGVGPRLVAAPVGGAVLFKGASVEGRAGFSPVFLFDGRSGAYLRFHPDRFTVPAFAANGSAAAWVAPHVPWWWYAQPYARERSPEAAAHGATLAVARFGVGTPIIEERRAPRGAWTALALDDAAERVLLSNGPSISLVDAHGGLSLDAAIPNVMAADFLGDGRVRLHREDQTDRGQSKLVVVDWNPQDDSRLERASVRGDARSFLLARRGDLSVVAMRPGELAIVDARTGAAHRLEARGCSAALVLSNGRLALGLEGEMRVTTPEGEPVARVAVEPRARVYAIQEPAPGELAVGLWTPSLNARRTLLVDAASGTVRRVEQGILPAGAASGVGGAQPQPGSFASRLFTDLDGGLVALEPDDRKRSVLAPGE